MSEPTWPPTEDDLEQALIDLGRHVVYPPLEPIDAVVRERLRAEPDRHASRTVQVAVHGLSPHKRYDARRRARPWRMRHSSSRRATAT